MAASVCVNNQYSSTEFVESAGAILFHASTKQICLVHSHERNQWLLAKGRRNIGETRQQTAIRESQEETGFPCRLLPVTLRTRCTPDAEELEFTPDVPRRFEKVTEPFMLTHRILPGNNGVKLIWWFIGVIDENAPLLKGEDMFLAKLFGFEDAMATLTFASDRDIVARAIKVYEETMS
ncbi:related to NUDIX domain [Ramularia collo-cygni]|uniref:Related to NUDIX domain n=1 Tax=Ramularia collo-cygni TaxID=112498 RepID=A0A2D3V3C7_9PEZI|nr:related to NUDIX domain [Ramularia collo-cygni]CZT16009.1 related to NUDIX domain [Ramularia collo-cygni]